MNNKPIFATMIFIIFLPQLWAEPMPNASVILFIATAFGELGFVSSYP
jgi:hypothetical protein